MTSTGSPCPISEGGVLSAQMRNRGLWNQCLLPVSKVESSAVVAVFVAMDVRRGAGSIRRLMTER
ncbi:hypothetical protein AB205_0071270 [Aquarana catesbeiana]|uniref:Uncharacterized protein n=1 Tax=Aquarana catesbeiana TaxID=8400 RepID=A0A2G9Q369_AQUCT|nr:hypothetical protein AB205_0071270 [Aquarana catesbeiana]